jgi:hypothetical protein
MADSPSLETRGSPAPAYDPLRFCIFTTIALIAWLVGAPAAVLLLSGIGLVAYGRAIRGGLTRSKCVLRRPALVMLYLGAAFVLAAAYLGRTLLVR